MSVNIEVAEERVNEVLVLLPVGRLDSANARSFESITMAHINNGAQNLIVDFSRLNFISSSGMRVLLIAALLQESDSIPNALPPDRLGDGQKRLHLPI